MDLEERLKRRYEKLVAAHSNCTQKLAAGVKALPDGRKAFAHTQALWRFLKNEKVTPQELAKPLVAMAHEEVKSHCAEWALCVHDWSRINYHRHRSKQDRCQMTHATDVGYELQSSLLVSDREGSPLLAPVQNWVTAEGVWQSRAACLQSDGLSHLDELSERMAWLEEQGFAKPLVHIIDREADSAAHLRRWSECGWNWLVRVKEGNRVRVGGWECPVREVASTLLFQRVREVQVKGGVAQQWLASGEVVVTRKAKPASAWSMGNAVRRKPVNL